MMLFPSSDNSIEIKLQKPWQTNQDNLDLKSTNWSGDLVIA